MEFGIDIPKLARAVQYALPIGAVASAIAGFNIDETFYAASAALGALTGIDIYFRKSQKEHTILRNFGIVGAARYMMESIGPELRQYWVANDTEERPFSRRERALIYTFAKDELIKSVAFGTLEDLVNKPMIKHSMFPCAKSELEQYSLTFGDERGCDDPYTISKPLMLSGMSFGALGKNAVRALSIGAGIAKIPMNTGEGGISPYHLAGGCDIIFQIGTGKFGVRKSDNTLDETKLAEIASVDVVKMIEIKFSQGAKPGKGGLLPKEKVNEEIARVRQVPLGKDIISPERHVECDDMSDTVKFIKKVQDISGLPVGIKLCLGNEDEFRSFVEEMSRQGVFPDYIALDGAEGGTGAAPQGFMDDVGIPISPALDAVVGILEQAEVRDKLKVVASGKLVDPGSQLQILARGADVVYSARGFLLALGCIQALKCNAGTCPAGIATHDSKLESGLIVDVKARRVANYVNNVEAGLYELLAATGVKSFAELSYDNIYVPKK